MRTDRRRPPPRPRHSEGAIDHEKLAGLIAERLRVAEVFDTKGAAAYLGYSAEYLEVKRCTGGGPPFVKVARTVRYRKSDLDAWMEKHVRKNTAHSP